MAIIDRVLQWLSTAIVAFLNLLPESPIQNFCSNTDVQAIFGYINWFVPVKDMLEIMAGVLSATIIWYAVRWVLRFARYVE